jgi:DNA mismatch repair protein MutS2
MKASSLRTLEYDGLLAIVARYLTSTLGRERRPLLEPKSDLSHLRREICLISELKQFLAEGSRFNFSELHQISESLAELSIQGSVLEPLQIVELEKLIVATNRTRSMLARIEEAFPLLSATAERLPDLRSLEKLLKGKILPTGELADDASPALDSIRKSIQKVNEKIQHTLAKLVQKESRHGSVQEDVITIRNDRFVIPVRVEQRKQVPGVFHGTSSSGATVYIEPFVVVDLNNELAALREAEWREVRRILAELTDQLRFSLEALRSSAEIIADLDIAQARAQFSIDFKCCAPELSHQAALTLEKARHPLLEDTLRLQNKTTVPISVDLNRGRNLLVISGPNTGGKTVALKTIGMAALMAQSGMHVAAERATLPIFDSILADIGDRQSIQESLSTFASHVTNLRSMADEVTPSALVLIDEIGTGTDPIEGEALGIATAKYFLHSGAFTIVTTHFSGLKIFASQTEGAVNASVEFDEQSLRPTFRLIGGVAGASSGIDIAGRLGLQEQIIAEARSHLSEAHVSMIEFLNQLKAEKQKYEVDERRLHEEVEVTRRERERLKEDFAAQWEKKVAEMERAFHSFVSQLETRALKTVESIGETSARQRARQELDREFRRLGERQASQLKSILSETQPAAESVFEAERDFSDHVYQVGETVRVRSIGKEALLHRIEANGNAEVLVGSFKMKVLLDDCQPAEPHPVAAQEQSRAQRAKGDPNLKVVAQPAATSEINLIGCTVEEALSSADKFLDQAFLSDSPRVRIIHGMGMGLLRRSLAELFAKHPQVERFYPASPDQGGNGVTIVELKV